MKALAYVLALVATVYALNGCFLGLAEKLDEHDRVTQVDDLDPVSR